METNLTFSAALVRFLKGDQIARTSWEQGMHLKLENGVIYFVEPNGEKTEWNITHQDVLADDWSVTKEAE